MGPVDGGTLRGRVVTSPWGGSHGAYAKDGPTYERTVLAFLSHSLA